jgi:hypothetical protein
LKLGTNDSSGRMVVPAWPPITVATGPTSQLIPQKSMAGGGIDNTHTNGRH